MEDGRREGGKRGGKYEKQLSSAWVCVIKNVALNRIEWKVKLLKIR